jgi:hypothetical protein
MELSELMDATQSLIVIVSSLQETVTLLNMIEKTEFNLLLELVIGSKSPKERDIEEEPKTAVVLISLFLLSLHLHTIPKFLFCIFLFISAFSYYCIIEYDETCIDFLERKCATILQP